MKKRILFFIGIILINCLCFISAESGMMIFQNSTAAFVATPQYNLWNESNFLTTYNASPATGTLRFLQLKNNPLMDQFVLATLDSNSDIKVQLYNSSANWSAVTAMTLVSNVNAYRAFYTEVEQNSGDVMVVYNNGTNGILGYQTWNNVSGWSSASKITNNLTGTVNWVKMASARNSDNIILVASDSNSRLTAVVWNGTSWGTSIRLNPNL